MAHDEVADLARSLFDRTDVSQPLIDWLMAHSKGNALFAFGLLMLVMFALGVAHLAWVGVLAIVMLVEKATPRGERVVVPVAACLGLLAIAAFVVPGSVRGL